MVKCTSYLKYFEPRQKGKKQNEVYPFSPDMPGLLAYRDGERLFLGQVKTKENTSMTSKDEILQVLDMLELSDLPDEPKQSDLPEQPDELKLSGFLVTVSAFNINMEVSRKLRALGADYVIALKGKHQNLYVDAVEYFQDILSAEAEEFKYDSVRSMEKPEDTETEERLCYTSTDISWLHYRRDWADIKSLAMIVREGKEGGRLVRKAGYYVSNLGAVPEHFLPAARRYWRKPEMIWWICVEKRGDTF